MGYALGRVESPPLEPLSLFDHELPVSPLPKYFGHVASIAINKKFRGTGIGKTLMRNLHQSFAKDFEVDQVTLLCRVSLFAFL